MATGNTLLVLHARAAELPGTSGATFDTITGASTPAEAKWVLDFDASASEYADFPAVLPSSYSGGGLTCTVIYSMSSDHDEGASQVRWEIGIRRINDDAEDIDTTAHTYDTNGVSDAVPSVVGEVSMPTIAFSDGADMDSWAVGELAIIRIYRDHDHADDDATGDAELHAIVIKET